MADKLRYAIMDVARLTEIDMRKGSDIGVLLTHTCEELGELAREIGIEDGHVGKQHKDRGKEDSQQEAIDLILCALSIYFARGGSYQWLGKKMQDKLDKWEKNQNAMKKNCED